MSHPDLHRPYSIRISLCFSFSLVVLVSPLSTRRVGARVCGTAIHSNVTFFLFLFPQLLSHLLGDIPISQPPSWLHCYVNRLRLVA